MLGELDAIPSWLLRILRVFRADYVRRQLRASRTLVVVAPEVDGMTHNMNHGYACKAVTNAQATPAKRNERGERTDRRLGALSLRH
jgi:hypothetical protein